MEKFGFALLWFLGLVLNWVFVVVDASPPFPCDKLTQFPFCNTQLPISDRVDDLVGRLTLEEKILQLVNNASAIPRLGIPQYEWWSEALHGVSNVGPGTQFGGNIPSATSFPPVILSAASFNRSLWTAIGQAVSTEARAMYNDGRAGLTYWSPNVNIFRDPRWGRGHETPGEDPCLTSAYAVSYVRALQQTGGADPNRLKVASCCKHYTAYDVDNWKGVERYTFNAKVTKQDLVDTYNPPFRSCVRGGNVASVMCSYNQVNGVPTCADPDLLGGKVRGGWKLNGYIVSDCDSVSVLYNQQHYASSPEDAVAEVLKAGLNLDCGYFVAQYAQGAVNAGKLNVSLIDESVRYNFATLMRLGWFDGDPAKQQFGNLGPNDVCTAEHQALAVDAARQGIVLLKNHGALPLTAHKITSLAVIGPNANVTDTMIGNYAGIPCRYTTPLQGLSVYAPTKYAPGCGTVMCDSKQLFPEAVQAASQADATILIVGADLTIEREALDRTSLMLPGYQEELVTQVANAARGPVVLVIMSGGPFDIRFAKYSDKIAGILWVGYPGQDGGTAIADVIFGAYNPAGRLPVTWYPGIFASKVIMTDMNMRPNLATGYPGRTYRFYTGTTVYRFGDGMSYTTFEESVITAPKQISLSVDSRNPCSSEMSNSSCKLVPAKAAASPVMYINIRVQNKGSIAGSHVVLLFSTPPSSPTAPQKQLLDFRRIYLPAGGSQTVNFKVNVKKSLSIVDESGNSQVPLGSHLLRIGNLKHYVSIRTS